MEGTKQTYWIPLADLMTGLMLIFMLVTAIFISRVEQTTTLIIDEYKKVREDMQLALQNEFKNDFKKWNADLLGDMTIRFNNPDVQFKSGSAELTPEFQDLIADFFPRYMEIIRNPKFKYAVKEIRIEGHTSSFWRNVSRSEAYFLNMELSQRRTRSTLQFIMSLPVFRADEEWFKGLITANGLSSSRPIIRSVGGTAEDERNQRVEFRIVTNAADRIERTIATQ
jgi:outer membrane protein OmpA-like peptidoglycan-associated protein